MNIGIVNDLAICIKSLQKVLTSAPEHRVVWIARNGQEAVERCKEHTPDLILMDLLMPKKVPMPNYCKKTVSTRNCINFKMWLLICR